MWIKWSKVEVLSNGSLLCLRTGDNICYCVDTIMHAPQCGGFWVDYLSQGYHLSIGNGIVLTWLTAYYVSLAFISTMVFPKLFRNTILWHKLYICSPPGRSFVSGMVTFVCLFITETTDLPLLRHTCNAKCTPSAYQQKYFEHGRVNVDIVQEVKQDSMR